MDLFQGFRTAPKSAVGPRNSASRKRRNRSKPRSRLRMDSCPSQLPVSLKSLRRLALHAGKPVMEIDRQEDDGRPTNSMQYSPSWTTKRFWTNRTLANFASNSPKRLASPLQPSHQYALQGLMPLFLPRTTEATTSGGPIRSRLSTWSGSILRPS